MRQEVPGVYETGGAWRGFGRLQYAATAHKPFSARFTGSEHNILAVYPLNVHRPAPDQDSSTVEVKQEAIHHSFGGHSLRY